MKLKNDFQTLAAAVTLGALSIGFAPAAAALSTFSEFSASASFSLTLDDVRDQTGMQWTELWEVKAQGFDDIFTAVDGAATADATANVVSPPVFMTIGGSILQTANASGSATNGIAQADVFTDLDIDIKNDSDRNLLFSFSYSASATAATVGDAQATGEVFMSDLGGGFDVQAFAEALSANGAVDLGDGLVGSSGTITLLVDAVSATTIIGSVDAFGFAQAVPVPAAVWLFGTGLLGLIGIARRKQAA